MLAKVTSYALIGLDGAAIQVEADISRGMPSFVTVGFPDTVVQESKERVRKEGPAYDLPIAVGILAASQQIWPDLESCVFPGELSLGAPVRHTPRGLTR